MYVESVLSLRKSMCIPIYPFILNGCMTHIEILPLAYESNVEFLYGNTIIDNLSIIIDHIDSDASRE